MDKGAPLPAKNFFHSKRSSTFADYPAGMVKARLRKRVRRDDGRTNKASADVGVFAPHQSRQVPTSPDWQHEIKCDGYGMIIVRAQDRVCWSAGAGVIGLGASR